MQQLPPDFELPPPPPPFDLPPPPPPGRGFSPRLAFVSFALTTFVLGGFCFGWLFLTNWRLLSQFRTAEVRIPGMPSVAVPVPPGVPVAPPPIQAPPVGETTAPRDDLPAWTDQGRQNVLLLGIDHRDDEPIDGSRSDTIMLVSIDPPSKSVVMVSLPRDLWVSIPGHGKQRINAAHALGGPALVARTIETNFGIPINNYARIDFRGFESIVDTLGGVIVDVEETIKDDEYPTEDYGVMRLFIPPGPQLMDGKLALQYARSRHGRGDFSRARRQQRVLVAMRDRGMQLNMLPRVPSLIGQAQQAVQTDFGVTQMFQLARLGSEIERDRIKSVVVDTTLAQPFLGPYGEDLLEPDQVAIRAAIAKAFAEAAGQSARVEVLNGTTRAGIARQLGDRLAAAGYDVVRVDTADRTDYPETSIVVLGENERAATTLAARLRLPQTAIRQAPVPSSAADVRIILGRNYTP
jgi:LCP family protein required for cell wall assembly